MARVVEEGESEDRPDPPNVRARGRGQVNAMMDNPVEQLREQNPEKEYRYVYAPPQGSQYSQANLRAAQGYRVVDLESEEISTPRAALGETGTAHRVADVVLMEIDKELKDSYQEELDAEAEEDARRAEEAYFENIRRETEGHARPTGSVESEQETYRVSPSEE